MRRPDQLLFVVLMLTALAAAGEAVTSRIVRRVVSRPVAFSVQCSFGEHVLVIRYSSAAGE